VIKDDVEPFTSPIPERRTVVRYRAFDRRAKEIACELI
jgi:hypothetical protein